MIASQIYYEEGSATDRAMKAAIAEIGCYRQVAEFPNTHLFKGITVPFVVYEANSVIGVAERMEATDPWLRTLRLPDNTTLGALNSADQESLADVEA